MQYRDESRFEQDLVAGFLLGYRERADSEEFAKIGEAFLDDILPHGRRSGLSKAVADLESIHCDREVLYRSLYRLQSAKAQGVEFPDRKSTASLADDFSRMARQLETLNEALAPTVWEEHNRRMTTVNAA